MEQDKREPDKSLQESVQKLSKAFDNLVDVIAKELKLYQLLDWIEKKLNK